MSTVAKPDLRWAQKYAEEAQKKVTEAPANKGSLEANLQALGACETAAEQKAMILDMLGEISGLRPLGNRVLVATYVAPQKSKGGVYYVEKRADTNRYEGKVGLVIAIGPSAFRYDGVFEWEGEKPAIGDWIWYRASDAPERGIRNVYCRMITDDRIEGITTDPTFVW